jgi:hypothetical protein
MKKLSLKVLALIGCMILTQVLVRSMMFATSGVELVGAMWLPFGMLTTAAASYVICRKSFRDGIIGAVVVAGLAGLLGPFVGGAILFLVPWAISALLPQ